MILNIKTPTLSYWTKDFGHFANLIHRINACKATTKSYFFSKSWISYFDTIPYSFIIVLFGHLNILSMLSLCTHTITFLLLVFFLLISESTITLFLDNSVILALILIR